MCVRVCSLLCLRMSVQCVYYLALEINRECACACVFSALLTHDCTVYIFHGRVQPRVCVCVCFIYLYPSTAADVATGSRDSPGSVLPSQGVLWKCVQSDRQRKSHVNLFSWLRHYTACAQRSKQQWSALLWRPCSSAWLNIIAPLFCLWNI